MGAPEPKKKLLGELIRVDWKTYLWDAPHTETHESIENLFTSLQEFLDSDQPEFYYLLVDLTETSPPPREILKKIQASFLSLSIRPKSVVFVTGKNTVANMAAQFAVKPILSETVRFFSNQQKALEWIETQQEESNKHKTRSFVGSDALTLGIIGFLFGCMFPILATSLICIERDISIWEAQFNTGPLIWIIDTAPLFLGYFGYMIGIRQDELNKATHFKNHNNLTLLGELSKIKGRRFLSENIFAILFLLSLLGTTSIIGYRWIDSKERLSTQIITKERAALFEKLTQEKLHKMFLALERMASRSSATQKNLRTSWFKDAKNYYQHYASFQQLAQVSPSSIWRYPQTQNNEIALPETQELHSLFTDHGLEKKTLLSDPFLHRSKTLFHSYHVIRTPEGRSAGYLIATHDPQKLFQELIRPDYHTRLVINQSEILNTIPSKVENPNFKLEHLFRFGGKEISLTVLPSNSYLAARSKDRKAPHFLAAFLAFSALFSSLIAVLYSLHKRSTLSNREKNLLLDEIKEGIYGLDLAGRTTFVNSAVETMLGYDREELIGKPMHDLIHHSHPDGSHYNREQCPMLESLKKGKANSVTNEVLWRKDGTSIPVDYTSSPIIEDGNITGAVVTFSDVTESRKNLQALRNSEEILREAQKIAKIGSWQYDLQTNLFHWTDQMFEIFPADKKDGEPTLEEQQTFIHPEDRARWSETFGKCLVDGLPYVIQFRIKDKEGTTKWVQAHGAGKLDENGKFSSLQGTCQDISDEKDHQRNLELLAYSSELGVWDWNLKTEHIRFDQRWCNMIGYSLEEVKPSLETWQNLVHPDDLPDTTIAFQQYLEGSSESYEVKFRMKHRDGHYVPVLSKGKITERDADGQPLMFSGTHLDLTNLQNIEEELENQKRMAQHQAKLASIGELAAGVGHEINNPLMIANGNIEKIKKELLSRSQLSKQLKNAFNKYFSASERIENIVKGLRTFARSDVDHSIIIDLNKNIQQTTTLIREIYEKDGIELVTHLPNKTIYIRGNVGRFQQALMNLITNARDAVEKISHRRIVITLLATENEAKIQVTDNGMGVPEKLRAKIFDNFFTTKDLGKGTGMGLTLTANIIKEHEGKLSLDSIEGKGTTFTISLPIVSLDEHTEEMNDENIPISPEKIEFNKILIVDDEEDLREILRDFLEELECTVDEASNGLEALEMVKSSHYDCVFTDMKMPIMDGYTLLKEINLLDLPQKPYLIAVTGGVNIDFSKEGNDELSELIDAYLLKPFDDKKVVEILTKLTNKDTIKKVA